MSDERRAWLHAACWALMVLIGAIKVGSVEVAFFASLGVVYCVIFAVTARHPSGRSR